MKKKIFGITIIALFVLVILNFYNEHNVVTKSINYNGNNFMISIDGVTSSTLPTSGSYYLASYDCKNSNTKLTWDSTAYTLDVSNGNKRGGISCYLDFETYPKLSHMKVGSYVSYVGDNNCPEDRCDGTNVYYVNDINMGYTHDINQKFVVNGWRIAYLKDGSAYLISAGSPEIVATDSAGNLYNEDDKSNGNSISTYDTTAGATLHMSNLNNRALTYCNKEYVFGGVCTNSSVWAMNGTDFQIITGTVLGSCDGLYNSRVCGYTNDLIDNGGHYWVATAYTSPNYGVYIWRPDTFRINAGYTSLFFGVRPVIKLDTNVVVTGGSGTYEAPYTIGNNAFWINDGATTVSNADKASVTLTMMTVNATKMCISTNTSVCNNYVNYADTYTLDWSSEDAGEKIVYVYYKDSKGRVVASMNKSITLSAS